MFNELSPILAAHDVQQALDYYEHRLGFEVSGKMGDPIEYAIVSRDGFSIHFKRIDEPLTAEGAFTGNLNAGKGGVYILVDDVDRVAAELVQRGAAESIIPEDKEYGMRDFWVPDPFGYAIAFGSPQPAAQP
ncbi:MAG: VOC family protein [Planctomycetota bacterium]